METTEGTGTALTFTGCYGNGASYFEEDEYVRKLSTAQSSITCVGDAGLRFSGMLLYRAFHLRASIDKSSGDGRSSLYSWTITLRLASWQQRTDGTRPSMDEAMMADFEKRSSRAVSIAYHIHQTTRERAQVHAGSTYCGP